MACFMIPPYVPSRRIRLPHAIESGSQEGEKSADDEARVDESSRIGLDGQWVVESGEAQSTGYGDENSENTTPGQLPEVTADGKEWGEWAREWRLNPADKANRLVNAWNAEAATRGNEPMRQVDKEVRPKSVRKGKGGRQKGSPGPSLGFGSPASRPTKGVSKRLVVDGVASDGGDGPDGVSSTDEDPVVDWSEGQQLVEHKKRDFTGEMEYEAERIKTMNPRDRELLRKRLRSALGKDETRTSKSSSTRTSHPAAGRGLGADGIDQVESNSPEREDVGEKMSVSMSTTRLESGDVAKGEPESGDDSPETREMKEAQSIIDDKWEASAASVGKKTKIDSSVGSNPGSDNEATRTTSVVADAAKDNPDAVPEGDKKGDDDEEELTRIRRSFGLGRSGAGGARAGAGVAGASTMQTSPRAMEMSNDSREPSTETQRAPAALGKEASADEDGRGIGGNEEERDRIKRAFGLGVARSAALGEDATTGRGVDA